MDPTPNVQRVLVTGGAGFIGSHLVARLVRDGLHVHVLHRPGGDLSRLAPWVNNVRLHPCDLSHESAIAAALKESRPDAIFHLAGDATIRHFQADWTGVSASVERNIQPALKLVVAAAKASPSQITRFVRLGGLEEYGNGPLPYHESQRESPVSPYSASQVAVTHYLQMLAPRLPFRVVTLRPALVYGPGQSERFFIPSLIRHCREGRDFRMTAGHQGRDLVYVDDVVEAMALSLTKSVGTGEVLNVGSGREYLMKEVAELILRLTGATIRILENPGGTPGSIDHLYASNEKAGRVLEWRPRVGFEEGLRRTIASFR